MRLMQRDGLAAERCSSPVCRDARLVPRRRDKDAVGREVGEDDSHVTADG